MATSTITPREITSAGMLKGNVWLGGCTVRIRRRNFDDAKASQGKAATQGGKGAKAKGGKQKGKDPGPRVGFEIHLNGGNTPADVMQVEAWEPAAREMLERAAVRKGAGLRMTKISIRTHTEKTRPWTTSRSPFFAVVLPESVVESIETPPDEWLPYHPVTPVADLEHLPDGVLVCVAGAAAGIGPKKQQQSNGDMVWVTNLTIRNGNDITAVAAWRDLADVPLALSEDEFYIWEAVKKTTQKGKDKVKTNIQLNYLSITEQSVCPAVLKEQLRAAMTSDTSECMMWSRTGGSKRDFESAKSYWMTISVCAALCGTSPRKRVGMLARVPSVLIDNAGQHITYQACPTCPKAVYEGSKSCSCTSTGERVLWMAKLTLTDGDAQLEVKVFEEMSALATIFADGEAEMVDPEYYHGRPERAEALFAGIAASPMTVLVSFEDSSYSDSIEAQMRGCRPTITKGYKPDHPLKPFLRFDSDTPRCPACRVAETSFAAGLGMSMVPGGAVMVFRTLLEMADKPSDVQRESETSPACRATRKVLCALRGNEDSKTYTLTQSGPINKVTRLLGPIKGQYIHAVVSWRGEAALTLVAFSVIEPAFVTDFRAFFCTETELQTNTATSSEAYTFPVADVSTPSRTQNAAMAASASLAEPLAWTDTLTPKK